MSLTSPFAAPFQAVLLARTSQVDGGQPFPVDSIPWGYGVYSWATNGFLQNLPNEDTGPAQAQVAAAQAKVAIAQTALLAAQDAATAALSAFPPIYQAYVALLDAQTQATNTYNTLLRWFQAGINGTTIDQVNTAQTAVTLATAAANNYQTATYQPAQNAYAGAPSIVAAAMSNLSAAQVVVEAAQAGLASEQFAVQLDTQNKLNENAGYQFQLIAADATNAESTSLTSTTEYCWQIQVSDPDFQLLTANALSFTLNWNESSTQYATKPDPDDPDVTLVDNSVEPTHLFTPMTEVISAGVGARQADGTWLLTGAVHTLGAPGPPSASAVEGPAVLPSTVVANVQYQGAELYRQGWSEYQTVQGQAPARYQTCTADNDPNVPAPNNAVYSGSLALVPVPPAGFDPTLTIIAGDYAPPTRPLQILDTFSLTCGTARQLPASLVPDAAQSTLTSPTRRTLINPAGMRLTLSNPQTGDDLWSLVTAVRDAAWPPDPTPDNPDPPAAPSTAFLGAVNYQSPSGDHAIAQQMRFKLTYNANDARVLTSTKFSCTHHWAYKRTNLLTGVVTMETFSQTIEYPIVVESGGITSYNGSTTDEAWTVIEAGANESVELVMLPGENPNPTTFVGVGGQGALVPVLTRSS